MFSKSACLIVLSCVIVTAPLLLGTRSPVADLAEGYGPRAASTLGTLSWI